MLNTTRPATAPVTTEWWSDSFFDAERSKVLAAWRTGAEADIDEGVRFHKSRAAMTNVANKRLWAKDTGNVLVQPLAGVTTLAGHIELMQYLQDKGGADILPTQIDSQTRTLNFAKAEEAIAASERDGVEHLNGFPIVNHGVRRARKVVEAVNVPIEMRIGTVHPQLPAEIAFAAGMSSMTAGPIY